MEQKPVWYDEKLSRLNTGAKKSRYGLVSMKRCWIENDVVSLRKSDVESFTFILTSYYIGISLLEM